MSTGMPADRRPPPPRPVVAGGLARLLLGFDRVVRVIALIAAGIAAAMLLASFVLICWSVVMRYFAGQPITWVDELVGYGLVAVVMLGATDALRRGEHIGVDVLTQRLGRRAGHVVAVAGLIAVGLVGVILIIEGWEMISFSRMIGILSTGYLAMPMEYPQGFVPLGGVLLVLGALSGLARMAAGLHAVDLPDDAGDARGRPLP